MRPSFPPSLLLPQVVEHLAALEADGRPVGVGRQVDQSALLVGRDARGIGAAHEVAQVEEDQLHVAAAEGEHVVAARDAGAAHAQRRLKDALE